MSPETGYMILALFFFFVFVYSLAWVYEDANARGKTGGVWLLIVWFTWPIGLLVYYLLRNKPVQL